MCKQLNPMIPSLDTIKKIKLPGYIAPKLVNKVKVILLNNMLSMCVSSTGVNFHMNIPSIYIGQVFANPAVSSLIVRYPVLSKKFIRFNFSIKYYFNYYL